MALDFSQEATEDPTKLDFSSEALDFSSGAISEEKPDLPFLTKVALGMQEAGEEVLPVIDMALGFPAFIAKLGATGAADIGATLSGTDKPLEKGGAIIEKAMEAPWMQAMSAPLSYMAGKDLSEGTFVGDVMKKIEGGIETAASSSQETYGGEAGEAVRQAANVLIAKSGDIVGGVVKKTLGKGKKDAIQKPSTEEVLSREQDQTGEAGGQRERMGQEIKGQETPKEEVVTQRTDAEDAAIAAEAAKQAPEGVPPPKPEEIGAIRQTINQIGSDVGNLADIAFGTLNTRLHNAVPEVGRRAMDVEMAIKRDTHESIAGADAALSFLERNSPSIIEGIKGKFAPEELAIKQAAADKVKSMWLNQDRAGLRKMVEESGDPKVVEAFDNMLKATDKVGKELESRGLAGIRENYLPRIVKDREGLLKSLGYDMKTTLEKALAKEAAKQGVSVKQLDDVSYSDVVNKFMRKSIPAGSGKAGLTKGRVFEEVTPEMQKYYYDPVETFHTNMERAWTEIHTADFFGRSKVIKDGKIDVDTSIGNYLNTLVAEGKLEAGSPKWEEMAKVLETRYKYGHLVPKQTVQNINNLSTVVTIANGLSAMSNISDFASAPFYYGLKPAMQAMAQKLTGKQTYSIKDFGLADHISEEFIGRSATQRLADNMMTLSLWKILDPAGKNLHFNSSLIRGQNWAQSPKGIMKLQERYGEAYGVDMPQLIADLAAKKDTQLTRSMVIWDVAQHQPLTKLQKTEMQTKSPNVGGMATKLKSFMISQADFARRNAYNEIKRGEYQQGFKNLMIIAGAWASVGVSQKAIKNWLLGKDDEIEAADVVTGMLGQVGYNEYAAAKFSQGRPAEGLGLMFTPPAIPALATGWTKKEEGKTVLDEAKIARKVPVIGPFLSEKIKQADKKRNDAVKALK